MPPNFLQVKYYRLKLSEDQTIQVTYKREKELDKGPYLPKSHPQCSLSSTLTFPASCQELETDQLLGSFHLLYQERSLESMNSQYQFITEPL